MTTNTSFCPNFCPKLRGGSRGKYCGGKAKKSWPFPLSHRPQNTGQNYQIEHSDTHKSSLYNCLQVLILHTAAVTKNLGQGSGLGGSCPLCRNIKPLLPKLTHLHVFTIRLCAAMSATAELLLAYSRAITYCIEMAANLTSALNMGVRYISMIDWLGKV